MGNTWIRLIAVGKLLKATALITFGVLAVPMVRGWDPSGAIRHWLHPESNHLVNEALGKIAGTSPTKLAELGIGSFVYAALFLTEGIGLWLEKRWAEFFTIIITTSFVPLEIYEIAKHPTPARVITLVLNLAAIGYLVWRVKTEKKKGSQNDRLRFLRAAAANH